MTGGNHVKSPSTRALGAFRVSAVLAIAGFLLALALAFRGRVEIPAARRDGGVRVSGGTEEMARRLDAAVSGLDPLRSLLSDRPEVRIEAFRSKWTAATRRPDRIRTGHRLGFVQLANGRIDAAIDTYRGLLDPIAGRIRPRLEAMLRTFLASAYLRRAEDGNCLEPGNPRACLLPIRGHGVHQEGEAGRLALEELAKVLELTPEDLGARWLLNLAAMNLGSHPEGVSEEVRWDLDLFGRQAELTEFPNTAGSAGVDVLGLSGGVVLDDLNGDGSLDLLVSSWGLRDPLRVFANDGSGSFVEITERAGLDGITGGLNLVHGDYDNDGDVDVFVLRGAWQDRFGEMPNSLLRNRGDGSFDDVTIEAGVFSARPTQTAAWGDYDGDGDLDLFVGNESRGNRDYPCELFRNNGDGTFTEVGEAVGVAVVGFVKAAVWGDYDNDGRPDLFLSRFGQGNLLLRNAGPGSEDSPGNESWRFVDRSIAAGVADPEESFPAWFWDYDQDGWLDLLVLPFPGFDARVLDQVIAGYLGRETVAAVPRLFRNLGDGTFEDSTTAAGLSGESMLAMGSNFGDLDNDGWFDFYVGTGTPDLATLVPNRMYRGGADGIFENVTLHGGFGHLQKGHGVAFGDIDEDGDQDVYAVLGGAYPVDVARNALFLNPGNEGRWLTLRLVGRSANRSAIGSRVRVVTSGPGGSKTHHHLVGSGGSFGASSLRLEVGLGAADAIELVEIDWPGGETERVEGLELDSSWVVREGRGATRLVRKGA